MSSPPTETKSLPLAGIRVVEVSEQHTIAYMTALSLLVSVVCRTRARPHGRPDPRRLWRGRRARRPRRCETGLYARPGRPCARKAVSRGRYEGAWLLELLDDTSLSLQVPRIDEEWARDRQETCPACGRAHRPVQTGSYGAFGPWAGGISGREWCEPKARVCQVGRVPENRWVGLVKSMAGTGRFLMTT